MTMHSKCRARPSTVTLVTQTSQELHLRHVPWNT